MKKKKLKTGKRAPELKRGKPVLVQRLVVLREVRKLVKSEAKFIELLLNRQESEKYQGAIQAFKVIKRWTEREMRKLKTQPNSLHERPGANA